MASIGKLGTAHAEIDLDFDYFGETIRVSPFASDIDFIEFMSRAESIDEVDEIAAMHATLEYIKVQIHPDDWDLFWATAKRNRQNTLDLLDTSKAILEAIAGFPTGQPSVSSDGRQSTARRSQGGSSSAARRGSRKQSDTERALSSLKGRPDLKLIVRQAAAARAAGESRVG
jgi:hypothetical protein